MVIFISKGNYYEQIENMFIIKNTSFSYKFNVIISGTLNFFLE